jgi:hypothetical protein
MGLMMGTLWLSSKWFASAGWPPLALLGAHVAAMLVLPPLLARPRRALQAHATGREAVPLALLALGGLSLATAAEAPGWMLGMALQAIAWALTPACAGPRTTPGLALALCGPLLLWAVGLLSPTTGPDALHGAQALLGALALAALAPLLWRGARRALALPQPPSTSADIP